MTSDTAISSLHAWQALDSRGKPTVGCEVVLADGGRGTALVPSGASTGTHEARELRDGEPGRYAGNGVLKAVANVEAEIAHAVRGQDAADQAAIDRRLRELDGTGDLGRLGANAVLSVSVAAAVAAARSGGRELWEHAAAMAGHEDEAPLLPVPMVNIISGGAHAGRSIDVQDFLVVPLGARSFAEAVEWASRVREGTAEVLSERGLPIALVADEGGLGPVLPTNRTALEVLCQGIERSGLALDGGDGAGVGIAIDIAATQFFDRDGHYTLAAEQRWLTSAELVAELAQWCADFPIVSLEDPLAEDDWEGWPEATRVLGSARSGQHVQLLGDDFFVTALDRLERGITARAANAVLVKPNQAGTLSDALDVVRRAHSARYTTVLSARSGETEDTWLADLAMGWHTGQIKVGSTMRSERTAKWNRLIQLESALGDGAVYAGGQALSRFA
ncbi:phosphopyruvate hydratase [Actinomadura sp. WMMB 499]|uniref:phosphopyruvate hydratase n=1 Tax=Actinomadura sp. WMMB 499 TaxID=1219491 RepID=UPI001246A0E7|nr:phosphopyruvate hydratase [Actinomadura sp. WMMB 499]QFG22415.1 phosphopyruvate hydratase [Actinomadura sp. WMMB 499]